jgi:hypothetical protein
MLVKILFDRLPVALSGTQKRPVLECQVVGRPPSDWQGKRAEQQAVYANRRRVRGQYGKSLLRRCGELIERSFAHCYETGGMRRCHLRGGRTF